MSQAAATGSTPDAGRMEVYPCSLGELCNSLDASPRCDRDLNGNAEAPIVSWPLVRKRLDYRHLSQMPIDLLRTDGWTHGTP